MYGKCAPSIIVESRCSELYKSTEAFVFNSVPINLRTDSIHYHIGMDLISIGRSIGFDTCRHFSPTRSGAVKHICKWPLLYPIPSATEARASFSSDTKVNVSRHLDFVIVRAIFLLFLKFVYAFYDLIFF